ncbi:MAG: DUF4920 domain-containing protein [Flavobacteriaceae bacterium]|uniref:DUF4920 domain-containing protein n=2 Tax=Flavobacterium kayseriense TaxID=2764714 RepID=A0ABR7JAH8_9FLAO|nr:DUF4920 domain-containing protein [Flavobacterium kayseriense]MBC5849045.1 DUF4920 domain-containing protein [Flavobacterium kayseriense]MBX9886613.1 DUF4920 domain-containing protein [Flavobacteriaceae bacterium]
MMKKTVVIVCSILALASCKKEEKKQEMKSDVAYASFGDSISVDKALSEEDILATYEKLSQGDTVAVKFKSKIKAVCKEKGCWMNLDLPEDKEVFVKFKDYAFFVPTDSKNEDVIISGKAYISVESVADLKHYAKDGGKSQAAIDSIVAPKTKYSLMADGVLIQK